MGVGGDINALYCATSVVLQVVSSWMTRFKRARKTDGDAKTKLQEEKAKENQNEKEVWRSD